MSLLDTQVGWLANQAQNYFTSGSPPGRTGAWHPNVAPYQPFRPRDGHVIIAIGNDGQFRRFCKHIGREELAADARFLTNSDRVANRADLVTIMQNYVEKKDSMNWMVELPKIAVPCGPINEIDQVFKEPQVVAREMRVELSHPLAESMSVVANPLKFSKTKIEYGKAPPTLGEDTDDVLARVLGLSEAEIQKLRNSEII